MSSLALVVMGKLPRPGHVKTRLARTLGDAAAAELYAAFLEDVLRMASGLASEGLTVWFAVAERGEEDLPAARAMVPPGVQVMAQPAGDLGVRIEAARAGSKAEQTVVVGSDSPHMDPNRIRQAVQALHSHDAVIGPTEDGGYDLIGFSGPLPELLEDIPWSTPGVRDATVQAAERAGIRWAELGLGYDIDEETDLRRLARDPALGRAPSTARALTGLGWTETD